MLLTKGELHLGLFEKDVVDMILSELTERFGRSICRPALASGYVRKGYRYLACYNGRFGCGITVRYHTTRSTRFCDKETRIFAASPEEIEEVIDYCFRRAGIEKVCKRT